MARIRSLKPDFWTDEKIVELSPLARLLFIGMWNFVDDYGRSEYSPKRLKMQILPADTADMSKLIGEIRGKKLIDIYTVDNKEYFAVRNFVKHQKVDRRTPSKIPPPPKCVDSPQKTPPDLEVNKYLEVEGSKEKDMRDSDESLVSLRRWFEEIMWPVVPKKVRKDPTWKEVEKLKPDSNTRTHIVEYFKSYPSLAATYPPGEFFAPMQDPDRVIKNKRYLDVLEPYQEQGGSMNGSPPRKKVYITRESYEAAVKRGETNISLRLPEESNV